DEKIDATGLPRGVSRWQLLKLEEGSSYETRQTPGSSMVLATGSVPRDRWRFVCRLLVLRDQRHSQTNAGYGERDRSIATKERPGSNRSAEPQQLQSHLQSARRRVCRTESAVARTTRADDGASGNSGSCAHQRPRIDAFQSEGRSATG